MKASEGMGLQIAAASEQLTPLWVHRQAAGGEPRLLLSVARHWGGKARHDRGKGR